MLIEFLTRNLFLCFEEEKALVIFGARERWQDTLKALLLSLMIKHILMARTLSNRPGSSTNRDLLSRCQKTNLVFLHLMLLKFIKKKKPTEAEKHANDDFVSKLKKLNTLISMVLAGGTGYI